MLLESLRVHEVVELTVVVQVVHVGIYHVRAFARVGRFEGFLNASTGQQTTHFNARKCLAFARFNELTGFDSVRFALEHDFKTRTEIVARISRHDGPLNI
ncbi:hypothetical protein D3C78_1052880 [compost metagenome]